jgi:hypothetical protein
MPSMRPGRRYDEWHAGIMDDEGAVATLAELAGDGPVLESSWLISTSLSGRRRVSGLLPANLPLRPQHSTTAPNRCTEPPRGPAVSGPAAACNRAAPATTGRDPIVVGALVSTCHAGGGRYDAEHPSEPRTR